MRQKWQKLQNAKVCKEEDEQHLKRRQDDEVP